MAADGQPDLAAALSTEKQSLRILRLAPDEFVPQDYQDPDSQEKATLHLHAGGAADVAVLQIAGTGFQPLALPGSAPSLGADTKLVLCSFPLGPSPVPLAPRLHSIQVTSPGGNLKLEPKADPGEAGAPLLDTDGKVVAIATSADQGTSIEAARKLIP